MRSKQLEQYKQQLHLDRAQRETLFGLLLGDAHLETQNGGRTYRVKIEQSLAHRDYVLHLYNLFQNWVLTPPTERVVVRHGRKSINIRFQTVSHGSFRFYGQLFYANKTKKVPRLIHRWLTGRALAYWFMDDGSIKSKQSRGLLLNTQSFVLSDVNRLVSCLKEVHGLVCQPRKQKDGYQIYISGDSRQQFEKIITPYIVESMNYKLQKKSNLNA